MNDKSLIVSKFRSLAKSFERFAEKGLTRTSRGVDAAELRRYIDIQEESGNLLVTAYRLGYLSIPGLAELVAKFDNPPPSTGKCRYIYCASNLFIEFCGNNEIPVLNTGREIIVEPEAKMSGGVLPTAYPEILPGMAISKLESGYPAWQAGEEFHAMVCNWLAEIIGADSKADDQGGVKKWSLPEKQIKWAKRFKTSIKSLQNWRKAGTLNMVQVIGQQGLWKVHCDDPRYKDWEKNRTSLSD